MPRTALRWQLCPPNWAPHAFTNKLSQTIRFLQTHMPLDEPHCKGAQSLTTPNPGSTTLEGCAIINHTQLWINHTQPWINHIAG